MGSYTQVLRAEIQAQAQIIARQDKLLLRALLVLQSDDPREKQLLIDDLIGLKPLGSYPSKKEQGLGG